MNPPLRYDDEPAAGEILPQPGVFYVSEGDRFDIDSQFAGGSQCPQLRECLEDGCAWYATATASVQLEPRAAQCGPRK
jgi:hypothetical protein